MKKLTFYLSILFALTSLLAACGGNEPEPQPVDNSPSVRFLLPRDGTTVSSPVEVKMDAINFTIEEAGPVNENAGHFHIMINEDCVENGTIIPADDGHVHFGKAQTETELDLEPGEYTLCLQIGDGLHTATELVDTISITVE